MADTPIPDKNPYLLRAMHQWMTDCGHTPQIIVDATRKGVQVPVAHVKDGRIVLNVSFSATQHLTLGNDLLEFDTRFSGRVHRVSVPMDAVLGIYARETNEGIVFSEHHTQAAQGPELASVNVTLEDADADGEPPPDPGAPPPPRPPPPEGAPTRQRPTLKIVK